MCVGTDIPFVSQEICRTFSCLYTLIIGSFYKFGPRVCIAQFYSGFQCAGEHVINISTEDRKGELREEFEDNLLPLQKFMGCCFQAWEGVCLNI